MGLDAIVFCDCYEKGRLKRQPPDAKLVYVLPNGDLGCRSDDPKAFARFERWRDKACRHEQGMVAGDYLGNIESIADLRGGSGLSRRLFPVLFNDILYSGSHTGDHLTVGKVKKLGIELERLKSFRSGNKEFDQELQVLRRQLQAIVKVALRLGKPIAF